MAKKCKKAKTIAHNAFMWSSMLSTVLSSVSFGSLTGAGVATNIPLGKHAGVCGVVSIVSAEVSQKLGAKILKQSGIFGRSFLATVFAKFHHDVIVHSPFSIFLHAF